MNQQLQALRQYFMSGATQSFAFRLAKLEALQQLVLDREKELAQALHSDLKKNRRRSLGL
jgi:aldehyde dehydrogenase (NAD+)